MSQVVRMFGAQREMGERSGSRRERRSGEAWARGTWLAVGLVAASVLGEGSAFAQQATAPAAAAGSGAPAAEDPDKLFDEGLQAAKGGNFKTAQEKLSRAFELKPDPKTAANLGKAELQRASQVPAAERPALWRSAAEHISFFLRNFPAIDPEMRAAAESELKKATAKVVEVTLALDPPAAEVKVDGRSAGKAPLRGSIFVEPGHRRFEATSDGYLPMSKELDVAAGGTYNVELALKNDPNAPPRTPPPSREVGRGPVVAPPPTRWETVRPYVMWGGMGLAVMGVGVGVGLRAALPAKKAEINAEADYLFYHTSTTEALCPGGDTGTRCAKLYGLLKARDAYQGVSIAGFVVGGVGAVGAIVGLLWKPSVRTPDPVRTSGVVVVPSLNGVTVMGNF